MLQAEVEVTGVDENVRTPEVTVPCYVIHVSAQQQRHTTTNTDRCEAKASC